MNNRHIELVEKMIRESGRMWLESMDRSETGSGPIIITRTPSEPVYLERRENYQGDLASVDGWLMIQQPLRPDDAASFYAAFGSHWSTLLHACHMDINGKPAKIRAFIKNGRTEGWNISLNIEGKE